jgi:segregation and condensation protein A
LDLLIASGRFAALLIFVGDVIFLSGLSWPRLGDKFDKVAAGVNPAANAARVTSSILLSMDQASGPRLDVRTPIFEGPLELLLALVEREELDIFQVSLARVTDAYLAEVAARDVADPREMAEFLWMAARLLLIKSIRLLPGEPPTDEETDLLGWEEDVRQRLEEYRAYKEMAGELMQRAEQDSFAFSPPARPVEATGQEEPLEVELLLVAFNSVLARIPPRPLVVTGRTWTLEEKLDVIAARLSKGPIELVELILESEDRLEAVITFVAVLELLRRSLVSVRQKERFGPIHVEAKQPAGE